MRKILIADDDDAIRTLVSITLEDADSEILEASDGFEALLMARGEQPDLVLLDVMMPGLTGFDVCRALKSDAATRDIKIVMLTARSGTADREEGQRSGADDYFAKPFSPVALLRKIDEMIEGKGAGK